MLLSALSQAKGVIEERRHIRRGVALSGSGLLSHILTSVHAENLSRRNPKPTRGGSLLERVGLAGILKLRGQP